MAKKKKKFNFKTKLMSAARRIFLHSPIRREAINRNKTPDGYHRCEQCYKLTDTIHIDHKNHVIPLTGFDNWDGVLNRLFCDASELQKFCIPCHSKKTKDEMEVRKKHRRDKKVKNK